MGRWGERGIVVVVDDDDDDGNDDDGGGGGGLLLLWARMCKYWMWPMQGLSSLEERESLAFCYVVDVSVVCIGGEY